MIMVSCEWNNSIDVFIFANREGNWLSSCIASLDLAVAFAQAKGIACNKTIIEWGVDRTTREWIDENLNEGWSRFAFPNASRADAKNAASELSNAESHVAFIDGSDMVGREWLVQATASLQRSGGICRPEALMTFGADSFSQKDFELILQPENAPVDPALLPKNPYPSGFVTSGDVVKTVKWPQRNEDLGWGCEDWWWNCLTIEGAIQQHVVVGVAHFRRMSVRSDVDCEGFRPGPIRR